MDSRFVTNNLETRIKIFKKMIFAICFQEQPLITTGDASVEYNSEKIIDTQYTCKTEKISNIEMKDVITLKLENEQMPLGVQYTHLRKNNKSENFVFVSIFSFRITKQDNYFLVFHRIKNS